MATVQRAKGAVQLSGSSQAAGRAKGAVQVIATAVGGATGKSNPLWGPLGGCLAGPIG